MITVALFTSPSAASRFVGCQIKSLSHVLILAFLLITTSAIAPFANAQEINVMRGNTRDTASSDSSFGYVVDYQEPLSKIFSYGLTYVNEGHLLLHHRDGLAPQLWANGDFLNNRLTLSAGVGPYLYADTTTDSTPAAFVDRHGLGVIYSISGAWHLDKQWSLQLRANRITTHDNLDTTVIVAGLGFKYDEAGKAPFFGEATASHRQGPNEIDVYIGRTFANNFISQQSAAQAIEYRRTLSPYTQWTVGLLNEGNSGPINRRGVLSELWITRAFFADRIEVGGGIGPYFSRDQQFAGDRDKVEGVVSFTGSIRFTPAFSLRGTWHRVATRSSTDTDVFLIGGGYAW